MNRQRIIGLLRAAVELAGDGGAAPFTDEEYDSMYEFLNELEEDRTSKRNFDENN